MTRQELLDRLARAIAENEGFFVTEAQAKARKIRYPTRAEINANPGNLRAWRDAKGQPYPTSGGYVDFVGWASHQFPGVSREESGRIDLAYEPIWAIGTGRTATPEIAQATCAVVRAAASGLVDTDVVRVLYGGSVTPDNAGELMAQPDIDGALVGGASLVPDNFAAIIEAA